MLLNFAKCVNEECRLKCNCVRYTSPEQPNQPVCMFIPSVDWQNQPICNNFVEDKVDVNKKVY
jgi:hypothetical protein